MVRYKVISHACKCTILKPDKGYIGRQTIEARDDILTPIPEEKSYYRYFQFR